MKKRQLGFTLIEIVIGIALLTMLGVGTATYYSKTSKQANQTLIDADRELIKTKCSIYYLKKSDHATKPDNLSEAIDKDMNNFLNYLSNKMGLPLGSQSTYDTIDARFKWVDSMKLTDEKLLDRTPSDDRYILDIETYQVYHVTDKEEVLGTIYDNGENGGDSLDDMNIRKLILITEDGSAEMTKVHTNLLVGNTLFVGGEGSMKLGKVTLLPTGEKVYDLTSKIPNVKNVLTITQTNEGIAIEYTDNSNNVKIVTLSL